MGVLLDCFDALILEKKVLRLKKCMFYVPSSLTDIAADRSTTRAVKFITKLNKFILGYFDPVNIFFDNKNKYFSG